MEILNKLRAIPFSEFVILLLCASMSVSLLSNGVSRNLFYLSFYFSLMGLCLTYKEVSRNHLVVFFYIFLLGASKTIWAIIVNGGFESISFYPYFSTGKKIIITSFIVLFLLSNLQEKHQIKSKIKTALILGFILSTLYGFWQYFNGYPRVEFDLDRATISAYCYSALSLAMIGLLVSYSKKLLTTALLILIFLISYSVIVFTGTRAAMIMHPVIFLILLVFSNKYKTVLATFLFLVGCIYLFYSSAIESKIKTSNKEIDTFMSSSGNKMTSLGSRFSMWDEGAWFIKEKPMGSSFEERENMIKNHILENKKNESALDFIGVNLHNEIIDTVSLQGIIGGVLLIFFYLKILLDSIITRNPILLSCIVCLISYGISDVIFFSSEATIFFMSLMVIGLFHQAKRY